MEGEHVKAHRTKKDKQEMSHSEMFVTDGNEKADELAKEGAMLDERFMAQTRAQTVQQREEVYAALQCAASFHWRNGETEELKPQPKERWTFVDKKREETRHRTEWCAAVSKYRCLRCGRGSTRSCKENVQGRSTCQRIWENRENDIWEATIW